MGLKQLLLLLFFAWLVTAAAQTFHYLRGEAYRYKFENRIKIEVNQGSTELIVSGLAKIEPLIDCEFGLKLSDVNIEGVSNPQDYIKKLESNLLLFSFDDGLIENVCPIQSEEEWVLNIKKAILSSLQISPKFIPQYKIITERDIIGDCETTYSKISESLTEGTKILKVKNFANCVNRVIPKISLIPNEIVESLKSVHASDALSNNDYVCKQTIAKEGIIQNVQCSERNRLSSVFDSKSELSLSFIGLESGSLKPSNDKIKIDNLLYKKESLREVSSQEVQLALNDLCSSVSPILTAESSKKFRKLVSLLKNLEYKNLKNIIEARGTAGCHPEKFKDLFYFAMLMSGGKGAIQYFTENLSQIQNEDPRKMVTLFSLPFITYPTEDTVNAILPFLRQTKSSTLTLFASSMIGNYLKTSVKNPDESIPLKEAIKIILNNIPDNCVENKQVQYYDIVRYLKSLGNIGFLTSDAIRKLDACIKHSSNSVGRMESLRVALIDTLSRTRSCHNPSMGKDVRHKFNSFLFNEKETDEVRISALKAMVDCSALYGEDVVIEKMIELGNGEHKFSNYVKSYISNLQKSKSPEKSDLRVELKRRMIAVKSTFETNIATTSKNLMYSYYLKQIKLGAELDIDYIFDNNKQYPTAINFKVNVPTHKSTVKLIEIVLRREGTEKLDFKQMVKLNELPRVSLNILNSFYETPKVSKTSYKRIHQSLKNLLRPFKYHSLSVHFNGNCLLYFTNSDLTENRFKRETRETTVISIPGLYFLGSQIYTLGSAFNLLDNYIEEPTVSGLPVHIATRSSSLFTIMQAKNLAEDFNKGSEFFVTLLPLFAFDINLIAESYIGNHRQGFKWRLESVSNFALNVKRKIDNKIFEVEMKMPKPELEVLRIKSGIFAINGNERRPVTTSTPVKRDICFAKVLKESLDVELCAYSAVTARDMHMDFGLLVKQLDPQMSGWKAMYSFEKERFYFMVKNLGSKNERKLEIEVLRNDRSTAKPLYEVLLNTPSFKYNIIFDKKESLLKFEAIRFDQRKLTQIRLFLLEYKVENLLSRIRRTPKQIKETVQIQIGNQKINQWIQISAVMQQNSFISLDTSIDYKTLQMTKAQNIEIKGKFYDRGTERMLKIETMGEVTSSQWPQLNFYINQKTTYKRREHFENELILKWSNNLNDPRKQIHLLQIFKEYKSISEKKHFDNDLLVKIGPKDINHNVSCRMTIGNALLNHLYECDIQNLDDTKFYYKAHFNAKLTSQKPLRGGVVLSIKNSNTEHSASSSINEEGDTYTNEMLLKKQDIGKSPVGFAVNTKLIRLSDKGFHSVETKVNKIENGDLYAQFKLIVDNGPNIMHKFRSALSYKEMELFDLNHFFSSKDENMKTSLNIIEHGRHTLEMIKQENDGKMFTLKGHCPTKKFGYDYSLSIDKNNRIILDSSTTYKSSLYKLFASKGPSEKFDFAFNSNHTEITFIKTKENDASVMKLRMKFYNLMHMSSFSVSRDILSFSTNTKKQGKDLFDSQIKLKNYKPRKLAASVPSYFGFDYRVEENEGQGITNHSLSISFPITNSMFHSSFENKDYSQWHDVNFISTLQMYGEPIYTLRISQEQFAGLRTAVNILFKAKENELSLNAERAFVEYRRIFKSSFLLRQAQRSLSFQTDIKDYRIKILKFAYKQDDKVIYGIDHDHVKGPQMMTDVITPSFVSNLRIGDRQVGENQEELRFMFKKKQSDFQVDAVIGSNRLNHEDFFKSEAKSNGKVVFLLNSNTKYMNRTKKWDITFDNKFVIGSIVLEKEKFSSVFEDGKISLDLMAKPKGKRRLVEMSFLMHKDSETNLKEMLTIGVNLKLNANLNLKDEYKAKATFPLRLENLSVNFESTDPQGCSTKLTFKNENLDKKQDLDLNHVCDQRYKLNYFNKKTGDDSYQHILDFKRDHTSLFSMEMKTRYETYENMKGLTSFKTHFKSVDKSWNGVFMDMKNNFTRKNLKTILSFKPPYLDKVISFDISTLSKSHFLSFLISLKGDIETTNKPEKRTFTILFDLDRMCEFNVKYWYENNGKKSLIYVHRVYVTRDINIGIEYLPTNSKFYLAWHQSQTEEKNQILLRHSSIDFLNINRTATLKNRGQYRDEHFEGIYLGLPISGMRKIDGDLCEFKITVKPLLPSYSFPEKLRLTDCFQPSEENCFTLHSIKDRNRNGFILYELKTNINRGSKYPLRLVHKRNDDEKALYLEIGEEAYGYQFLFKPEIDYKIFMMQNVFRFRKVSSDVQTLIEIWTDAKRRPSQKLQLKRVIADTPNEKNNMFLLSHPHLLKPIILKHVFEKESKNHKFTLDFSRYPDSNLNLQVSFKDLGTKYNTETNLTTRLFRDDSKIDIHFDQCIKAIPDSPQVNHSNSFSLSRTLKWKSSDGSYKSLSRDATFKVLKTLVGYTVHVSEVYKRLSDYFSIESVIRKDHGSFIPLIEKLDIAFEEKAPKYRVTSDLVQDFSTKCVKLNFMKLNSQSDTNNHANLCFNRKSSINKPTIVLSIGNNKTINDYVNFNIVRKENEDDIFVITLKWKPEVFQIFSIDAIQFFDKLYAKQMKTNGELLKEIKHQWNIFYPSLHEEVISPLWWYYKEELRKFLEETEEKVQDLRKKVNDIRLVEKRSIKAKRDRQRSSVTQATLEDRVYNKTQYDMSKEAERMIKDISSKTHIPAWAVMLARSFSFRLLSYNPNEGEIIFEMRLISI
ncbi:uncharacterized protein B4U79_17751 [Dinothrombium tinctorium]|uniref:Vitellogenin domain-containing protein n=1 Tax=Dinothrombium tinctorium TaxID=1965070 RepID=A0A3S3RZZ9_9ACAR|nr:uncharacterized protein B4U79_16147 [Dinothrombium tinctorium]RWS07337.1 uncharacterized protein B4U79_16140 [Dinothrombium tinctorium]RWS08712.1 uncharacterized protein B4U79_17751 [Dinothrombium tinctorium]